MAQLEFDTAQRGPLPSLRHEVGAYEALWCEPRSSFKKLAERAANDPKARPSDWVPIGIAEQAGDDVLANLAKAGVTRFTIHLPADADYPPGLADARHPVRLLYAQGDWALTRTRIVSVVGTRTPSAEGAARARQIAHALAGRGLTVASGLAKGIDTAALTGALDAGGRVIAVIGTPLGTSYPKENKALQDRIAADHLLVSQVPVLRHARQGPRINRLFFPERNATMSALSEATIIVEAGETSGTLIQGRAALFQGRKLLILEQCFGRGLAWPERFEAQGAIRIKTPADLWKALD